LNFETFDFNPLVSAGITAVGYENPTPIQERVIPHVVNGYDVMGLAQTGTGKTAAFVLPILHRLLKGDQGCIRTLILAPTRELAEQIHQAIIILGQQTRIRSVAIYGGVGIHQQIHKLKRADIVVACPGVVFLTIFDAIVSISANWKHWFWMKQTICWTWVLSRISGRFSNMSP
jgi:superfamily II DNA/RNA helicase